MGIHMQTDWWEGFMKYAVEMGSDAMIYIPSFIKTGSGIQKLMGENSQTHILHDGDLISLFSCQNKENRLKLAIFFY
jgi:hypothetical protein